MFASRRVPGASTASWTVNAARPEATLFQSPGGQNFQIITHFLSPNEKPIDPTRPVPFGNATWQSSFDSSRVWAAVLHGNVDPAQLRGAELPEYRLDCLPIAGGRWCKRGANGRHTAEQNQLHPTLKH